MTSSKKWKTVSPELEEMVKSHLPVSHSPRSSRASRPDRKQLRRAVTGYCIHLWKPFLWLSKCINMKINLPKPKHIDGKNLTIPEMLGAVPRGKNETHKGWMWFTSFWFEWFFHLFLSRTWDIASFLLNSDCAYLCRVVCECVGPFPLAKQSKVWFHTEKQNLVETQLQITLSCLVMFLFPLFVRNRGHWALPFLLCLKQLREAWKSQDTWSGMTSLVGVAHILDRRDLTCSTEVWTKICPFKASLVR